MENFVYEFGFLPFPPYTKYRKMFDRSPAELLGGTGKAAAAGELAESRRDFVMYQRDEPPQYATPRADHATKYKDFFGEFQQNPCPNLINLTKGGRAEERASLCG